MSLLSELQFHDIANAIRLSVHDRSYWRELTYVKRTHVGWGLFAKSQIPNGQVLFRLHGQVVPSKTYGSTTAMELGDGTAIEPYRPYRFINHSCEPNCVILGSEPLPEVGLFQPTAWLGALRDIAAKEELTIDYNWQTDTPCLCGTASCRKKI